MISVNEFHRELSALNIDYFTGVPDSTFKEWISYLDDNTSSLINRIAANEGNAIAHCVGYHLTTGKVGIVYMQNSGFGNCINPLTSLADSDVYGIPMILMIGWRGMPGEIDEPQHKKMGMSILEMLDAADIPYSILGDGNVASELAKAKYESEQNNKPYALIVKKGFFKQYLKNTSPINKTIMMRDNAIRTLVDTIDYSDIVLSTTGFTSRELFEICNTSERGHENNFYNVGSMGHIGAIGLEVALQKKNRRVYILDGDGALIMHMGALATIGHYKPKNLIHIVFDNEAYESTGGQATVSNTLNFPEIMRGCGYVYISSVDNEKILQHELANYKSSLSGIIIKVAKGSRKGLGRPTDMPSDTKKKFMNSLLNRSLHFSI